LQQEIKIGTRKKYVHCVIR